MTVVRVVLILLAFIVLLVTAIMNGSTKSVDVWFGRWFTDAKLSIVMLCSFAFGAACVGIFTVISEIRLRTRLLRQRREIDALMEELRALRNAPLDAAGSVQAEAQRPERGHEIEED